MSSFKLLENNDTQKIVQKCNLLDTREASSFIEITSTTIDIKTTLKKPKEKKDASATSVYGEHYIRQGQTIYEKHYVQISNSTIILRNVSSFFNMYKQCF